MKIAVQILIAAALGVLVGKLLQAVEMPWFIWVPACVLAGWAVSKNWPWGADGEALRQAQEASVLGAMVLGAQTVIDIWRICDRNYLTVATTLKRLEDRGVIISLPDDEAGLRRRYFIASGGTVGADR